VKREIGAPVSRHAMSSCSAASSSSSLVNVAVKVCNVFLLISVAVHLQRSTVVVVPSTKKRRCGTVVTNSNSRQHRELLAYSSSAIYALANVAAPAAQRAGFGGNPGGPLVVFRSMGWIWRGVEEDIYIYSAGNRFCFYQWCFNIVQEGPF